MEVGITTEELTNQYPELEVFGELRRIGFDAVDYSYDTHARRDSPYASTAYLDYARQVRRAADNAGIRVNQMHAPLYHRRIDVSPSEAEREREAFLDELTLRGFEVAEVLGCRYMVMHPRKMLHFDSEEDRERARKYNMEMFRSLEPLARRHGVTIALENMFSYHPDTGLPVDTVFRTAEELASYLDELDSPCFAACLDTGHANVNGLDPAQMVDVLGERLRVLHVHDNHAPHDSHLICGLGTIDWQGFVAALGRNGFEGVFSLETCGMCERLPQSSCKACVEFERAVVGALLP